jgi:hypothetical protein
MVKVGFYGRNQVQRFQCKQCGKRFPEPQQKPFEADVRLPQEKVAMILHCLVEGNSVRSTSRLCDVEKRTVLNMLKLVQAVDQADLCVLKKVGESESGLGPALLLLQMCRVHGSLRITPAMAAGIADHVWMIDELIGV